MNEDGHLLVDAQHSKDLVAEKARAWLAQQEPCSEDLPPGKRH